MRNPPPIGFKIFAVVYVIKSVLPPLIVAALLSLNTKVPESLALVFTSLSRTAYKVLTIDNYPLHFSIIFAVLGLIVVYKFWAGRLWKVVNSRSLSVLKFIVIANIVLMVLKVPAGTSGYGTGELNSTIFVLSTFIINIAFLIYLFSKEAKNYFSPKNVSANATESKHE